MQKFYDTAGFLYVIRIWRLVVSLTVTSPPYNMRTRIRNGEYTTQQSQPTSVVGEMEPHY